LPLAWIQPIISFGSGLLNFSAILLAIVVLTWGLIKSHHKVTTPIETFVVEETDGDKWKLDDDEITGYLALAGWPESLQGDAKKVITCESGGRPYAENKETKDYGLLQVNYGWHKNKVGDVRELFSPYTNLLVGLRIYREAGGWQPWKASIRCHGLS